MARSLQCIIRRCGRAQGCGQLSKGNPNVRPGGTTAVGLRPCPTSMGTRAEGCSRARGAVNRTSSLVCVQTASRAPEPRRVNWAAPRHSPSAPTLRASNRGSKTPRAMARWACKLWSCAWGSQASVIGLRRRCESIARLVGLPAGPRGPEDGLCPCCAVRRQLHEREQLLARQEG